jgi:hypothetical protein
VSNLSKTSGMHVKSFINIVYYIHLSFSIFSDGISLFRFKKYTANSAFHIEHCRRMMQHCDFAITKEKAVLILI